MNLISVRNHKYKNLLLILLVSTQIILNTTSCRKMPPDEEAFKYLVKKWYKAIACLIKASSGEKPIGELDVEYELHLISNYIASKEDDFRSFADDFKNFMRTYPSSPWTDDSALCLGIQYLLISTPETSFKEEAIQAYRIVVDKYPHGVLQPWTLDILYKIRPIRKAIIMNPFGPPTDKYFSNLSIYQKVREVFIRSIVTEHLKVKDYEGSEREYAKLKEDTMINPASLKIIEEIIELWKEHANEIYDLK